MDIRVAGTLTDEQGRLLLLEQDADSGRSWSLPGGKVKRGDVGDVTSRADTTPIRGVQFVRVSDLTACGFSERFRDLASAG